MFFIDLNTPKGHTSSKLQKEMACEFRKNNLFPTHGLSTHLRIPSMCPTIPWSLKYKSFSCWDQFLCMAFAQFTYWKSQRHIEASLLPAQRRLYHIGIQDKVSCNTLAHANQVRDWPIYGDFAKILISCARGLYTNDSFGVELNQTAWALDSTLIDLCLSLFPWAKFQNRKGAVKLHTLLDLHGSIPSIVIITHGKVHDVTLLDQLIFEPGAFYIVDRSPFTCWWLLSKKSYAFEPEPLHNSTDFECDSFRKNAHFRGLSIIQPQE